MFLAKSGEVYASGIIS
jgi:hypothetical protein